MNIGLGCGMLMTSTSGRELRTTPCGISLPCSQRQAARCKARAHATPTNPLVTSPAPTSRHPLTFCPAHSGEKSPLP